MNEGMLSPTEPFPLFEVWNKEIFPLNLNDWSNAHMLDRCQMVSDTSKTRNRTWFPIIVNVRNHERGRPGTGPETALYKMCPPSLTSQSRTKLGETTERAVGCVRSTESKPSTRPGVDKFKPKVWIKERNSAVLDCSTMFLSTRETWTEFVYPGCWHFDNGAASKIDDVLTCPSARCPPGFFYG